MRSNKIMVCLLGVLLVGRAALIHAARRGRTDTAQALIEAGADVNVKDEDGKTVLMWAAEQEHTDIVNLLKEHGARG